MIYFILSEATSLIKIGTTKRQMAIRMAILKSEYRRHLTLLGVMDGHRPEEKALHERFAHLRVKGEWFKGSDELRSFIKANGKMESEVLVDGVKMLQMYTDRAVKDRIKAVGLAERRKSTSDVLNLLVAEALDARDIKDRKVKAAAS